MKSKTDVQKAEAEQKLRLQLKRDATHRDSIRKNEVSSPWVWSYDRFRQTEDVRAQSEAELGEISEEKQGKTPGFDFEEETLSLETAPQTSETLLPSRAPNAPPFSLDYSLELYAERKQIVDGIIEFYERKGRVVPQKYLDLLSNYLLCGAEKSGELSPVQRKEVELEGNSKKPRAREKSLEELLESPTFNETATFRTSGIIYKTPKPNFDRARQQSLGNSSAFLPLWSEIDKIDRLLRLHDGYDVSNPTNNERFRAETLSRTAVYQLRHLLVELRKEQYTIGDSVSPALQLKAGLQPVYRGGETDRSLGFGTEDYPVLPLGIYQKGNRVFEAYDDPRAPELEFSPEQAPQLSLDFRNPQHVYLLNEFREELEEFAIGDSESTIPSLYQTFDWFAREANLTPKQELVLKLKSLGYTNQFISEQILEKFGVKIQPAYISTIYTKQVCLGIAEKATLIYDTYCARKDGKKFQVCRCCGRRLFLDSRVYSKNKRMASGLEKVCKECQKKARDAEKKSGS